MKFVCGFSQSKTLFYAIAHRLFVRWQELNKACRRGYRGQFEKYTYGTYSNKLENCSSCTISNPHYDQIYICQTMMYVGVATLFRVLSPILMSFDMFSKPTDIYKGDTRARIPPCVMASSAMGLKLGVFWFLPTTHTAHANKMHLRSSRAMRRFMCGYFHTPTAIHTHLMNHGYFDHRKNPETPNLRPLLE